ncbi:serine/threonine-protein phosphatase 4 regulatory subunit 2 isoform X4 [Scophthalmus maximus]|uniref:serine/threonine-protein phosphatase 4 regulatory subunit 2 isoform X4 n=1 Tax=Scophthalmus maximus TaxID=52904 RepID=UPI001FA81FD8|nr:serine/threonine-protein phosphatase 4 regulatory subunit 2 isoform X4 [Scophthalmus maximus]
MLTFRTFTITFRVVNSTSVFDSSRFLHEGDTKDPRGANVIHPCQPFLSWLPQEVLLATNFEKKGKKETCPVLEQFLCHVAKTGQPPLASPISSRILWPQLKDYFMFKLEKVMEDFQASSPEQRGLHNPNVEYVPYQEMKTRILKIVDGYKGIPFTIQRLCELLMDPKRNYAGTEKFLRGLEKNVMVVSCVYPTSEKNGASSVNRMNGVMFPGSSSLYSDSQNVNGPALPKSLNRPKLSLSTLLPTNGLPDRPVGKEPAMSTEEVVRHHVSDSSQSESEMTPNSGTKNKHPEEEEEEEEDSDADKQDVKRLKFDETESEEKESPCHKGSESSSSESSKDSCGDEDQSGSSCDTTCDRDPRSPGTEILCGTGEEVHGVVDQPEPPAPSGESTSSERDNDDSSSSVVNSDGESPPSDKPVPSSPPSSSSSSSSSPDRSAEGDADGSHSTDAAVEPGEHD